MLVSDIYVHGVADRVGDFVMSVWNRRKEILYGNRSVGEVSHISPILECAVNETECYGD